MIKMGPQNEAKYENMDAISLGEELHDHFENELNKRPKQIDLNTNTHKTNTETKDETKSDSKRW